MRRVSSSALISSEKISTPCPRVSMKLKRAFTGMIADEWSDHAVFDQRPANFADNVAKSDLYEEIFWRAIDGLDRIAGVNLSEQGE